MYQDLSTRNYWPGKKKAIVDLLIKMKENSKRTSGNSLSPLGARAAPRTRISVASQTLLTEVK